MHPSVRPSRCADMTERVSRTLCACNRGYDERDWKPIPHTASAYARGPPTIEPAIAAVPRPWVGARVLGAGVI